MPNEWLVPTDRGKIRVRLDRVPTDPKERNRLIDDKIAAGEFEPVLNVWSSLGGAAADIGERAAPAVIGGVLGGLAGGPVGSSVGGMAGEAVTQFIDPFQTGARSAPLSEKIRDIGLAGAVPGAARAVRATASSTLRGMPGVAGGLQEAAQIGIGEAGEKLLPATRPGITSKDLFWAVSQQGGPQVKVSTAGLRVAADELKKETRNPFAPPSTAKLTGKARQVTRTPAEEDVYQQVRKALGPEIAESFASGTAYVGLDEYMLSQQNVGAIIRQMERKGGRALGAAKKLYAAMWDDLDEAMKTAPANVGPLLRDAIATKKLEVARAKIADAATSATTFPRGLRNMNVAQLRKYVEGDKETLQRLMKPADYTEMVDILDDYAAKTPNITSLNIQQSNFGRIVDMLGPNQLADLLLTSGGRRTVRYLAEHGHLLQQPLTALGQVGRVGLTPRSRPEGTVDIPPIPMR